MIKDNQIIKMILGFKVRHLRQQLGLSYQELSEKTGLSVSYINDIERGKKYPKPDKIQQLGEGLGVNYNFMVSTNASKKLQPVIDLLNSKFFKLFPLDEFGISPDKLLELFTNTPDKVSAFVSTIFKIARHYQITDEEFFKVALRSYQDMHNNYFPDLEKEVQNFRAVHKITEVIPNWGTTLEAVLKEGYGIEVDRGILGKHSNLENIRSFYQLETKKLLLNKKLTPSQEHFLMARELAFQFFKMQERPYETRILKIKTFDELLNNFKASYFAVALLMDEKELVKDIQKVSRSSTWDANIMLHWMDKYHCSQEMLMQRLTNILPHHFGIEDLFFLRISGSRNLEYFRMTKELHLSQLHNPYNNRLEEHYCRRWVSITALKELRTKMAIDPKDNRLADGQISKYWNTDNEYFCLSLAKPAKDDPKGSVSVTIGLMVTPALRGTFNFLNDPELRTRVVNTTCERCSMPSCESRFVPPVMIEKQREEERILEELEGLE